MSKPIFRRGPLLGLRFLLLLLLSTLLMLVDHRGAGLPTIHRTLNFLLSPVIFTVDLPFRMGHWISVHWVTRSRLQAENQALREEERAMQVQLQKLLYLEHENQQFRALLKASPQLGEQIVSAQLLAVSLLPLQSLILINKGNQDKAYVGQPVLDAKGVMGQIIAVHRHTSKVMLVTDQRSAVPVQVIRNGLRAIAVGDPENGGLTLVHLPKTSDIEVGDALVTSGLGEHFPVGYPVGVVRKLVRDADQRFASIQVEPRAHLHRSRQLLLLAPPARVKKKEKQS